MASFYGNDTGQHWQAYCEWNVTNETDDTVTISGTTYFHSIAWGFQVDYVNGRLTIDGNQNFTTNNHVETASGETKNVALVTHSVTLVKGDSPRVITINAGVRNQSGYRDGYSEGAVQYTVPAKTITTYTVSYDANGGTGAPSPQTKTKGVTLQLSTQEPTRAGYVFEGWSLTKNGVVQYKPGGYISVDANSTLYAVWSYDRANAPVVTSSSVYRVASSSSTTPAPNGNYVYFSVSWRSGVNVTSVEGQYQSTEGITFPVTLNVQGDTTGTTGTSYGWFAASSTSSYSMMLTITNSDGQSTDANFVIREFGSPIIDVKNAGKGVGILSDAPNEGVSIGSSDAGGIKLECDIMTVRANSIEKPAISIGWEGSGFAHNLTSTNEVFSANKTFGQSGGGMNTAVTSLYRSGNYVYIRIPASDEAYPSDVCFEVSAQARVDSISSTNMAMGINIEHTSGTADDSDVPETIGAPIMTNYGLGFQGNFIVPRILQLPRSTSANIYRLSLIGRSTNSTGSISSWYMTVKML